MKTFTEKRVSAISFIIVGYFALLYLVNVFKVKAVIIGVFVELLTIPFLIAQVVFLFLGVQYLNKKKKNLRTIISVLLLMITTAITISSFYR